MTFTFPKVTAGTTPGGFGGYAHPDGRISPLSGTPWWPRWSDIGKAVPKGDALMRWAANQERDTWRAAAIDLYGDIAGKVTLSPASYAETLDRRVGQTRAWQREQQKALDIGSAAHKLIEYEIRKGLGQTVGRAPVVPPKAMWAVMAVQDWFMAHQVKPLYVEGQVFAALGYAGTFDLLARVDGVLSLIDWKTSKSLYPENDVQIAAYAQAIVDMGHPEVERAIVIRIPKEETETEVEVHEVPHWRTLQPVVEGLCRVWQWWQPLDAANRAAWLAKKQGAAA